MKQLENELNKDKIIWKMNDRYSPSVFLKQYKDDDGVVMFVSF